MRACLKCGEFRIDSTTDPGTRVCRECELERQATERPFSSGASEQEKAEAFILQSGWHLAITMLDIPHQYTVRDLASPDARKTTARTHSGFEWFVAYVRANGIRKRWGRYENTYLVVGEWEYWTMGFPVEETTIINRQAVGPRAIELIEAQVRAARGG